MPVDTVPGTMSRSVCYAKGAVSRPFPSIQISFVASSSVKRNQAITSHIACMLRQDSTPAAVSMTASSCCNRCAQPAESKAAGSCSSSPVHARSSVACHTGGGCLRSHMTAQGCCRVMPADNELMVRFELQSGLHCSIYRLWHGRDKGQSMPLPAHRARSAAAQGLP